MLATPYLTKARSCFAKLERAVPQRSHNTLAVTLTAAALALVPAGAAFAATTAAHTTRVAAATGTTAVVAKATSKPKSAPAAAPQKPAAAAAPAVAPVAAVADPYKTSSVADLESTGLVGSQESFTPNSSQWANAATITDVAKQRGMAPYAAVIAVAVAMQESSLENIDYGDRDSLGLFQQRPSMGWGSPSELTNPSYAANAFLSALQRSVPGYRYTTLWQAAQTVQESGFPTAYAKWQAEAAKMVHSIAA
jgi:hypothetical protein